MTFALTAFATFAGLWAVSRLKLLRAAAAAPGLTLAAGAAVAFFGRIAGAPAAPADILAATAEALLAALVFASAAQIRVTRFAKTCPAGFRLTLGGAPLYLLATSLAAFVLLPQLSVPSALLLGAALMLNGAAFDRRAVTATPAPAAIKSAVRMESAAIIAFGAPIAVLIAANAVAPAAGEAAAGPLLEGSLAALKGFAFGGILGLLAGRFAESRVRFDPGLLGLAAGGLAVILAEPLGADPLVAAGAAGLLWGEETGAGARARLNLRRLIEQGVAPFAYFAFAATLAPRLIEVDLLTVLFAAAAVTVMRAGPRLAMLQSSNLPPESRAFLAWFGGAPGAASALFALSLIDDAMIADLDAFLTVAAISVMAGIAAARLTSKPLANGFLRQLALSRRRRLFAG